MAENKKTATIKTASKKKSVAPKKPSHENEEDDDNEAEEDNKKVVQKKAAVASATKKKAKSSTTAEDKTANFKLNGAKQYKEFNLEVAEDDVSLKTVVKGLSSALEFIRYTAERVEEVIVTVNASKKRVGLRNSVVYTDAQREFYEDKLKKLPIDDFKSLTGKVPCSRFEKVDLKKNPNDHPKNYPSRASSLLAVLQKHGIATGTVTVDGEAQSICNAIDVKSLSEEDQKKIVYMDLFNTVASSVGKKEKKPDVIPSFYYTSEDHEQVKKLLKKSGAAQPPKKKKKTESVEAPAAADGDDVVADTAEPAVDVENN